jgi:hypothetical protein
MCDVLVAERPLRFAPLKSAKPLNRLPQPEECMLERFKLLGRHRKDHFQGRHGGPAAKGENPAVSHGAELYPLGAMDPQPMMSRKSFGTQSAASTSMNENDVAPDTSLSPAVQI